MIKTSGKNYPPNYSKIIKAFPMAKNRAVFCYGDTIFNPFNLILTPDLCEHEEVHSIRQGNDPEAWWDEYIASEKFRLEEELLAYTKQYTFLKPHLKLRQQRAFLAQIAKALSGDIYGHIISFGKAKKRVRALAEDML